jgi:hypothetical protein
LDKARKLGWLRRDIDWAKPSKPGQQSHHDVGDSRMVVATVHVPRVGPRKPEASFSGLLSNSGVRYRRLRIAEARLLYLCAAIREHHDSMKVHSSMALPMSCVWLRSERSSTIFLSNFFDVWPRTRESKAALSCPQRGYG